MRTFTLLSLPAALAALLTLAACGGEQSASGETTTDDTATATADPLAGVLLSERPSGEVISITAARANASPGDEVVLRGRIGGRAEPILAERASLILADDEAIEACDTIPGDVCQKPWDFCCVPSEKIAAAVASIQVTDASGAPVAASLASLPGVAPGAHILVTGTVAEGSGEQVFIVDASGIFVEPQPLAASE